MVERVVDQHVAFGRHPLDGLRVGPCPHAGHAERGRDVRVGQRVENIVDVAAIRSRVERQRDDTRRPIRARRNRGRRFSDRRRRVGLERRDTGVPPDSTRPPIAPLPAHWQQQEQGGPVASASDEEW